jgi:CHAT domain-containing protein
LPYARAEGIQVSKALKEGGFETESLINRSGLDILNNLYNKEYKLLHIAGHGTISDNPHETGIVLENGMYITPDMLKNLSGCPSLSLSTVVFPGRWNRVKKSSISSVTDLRPMWAPNLSGWG